MKIFSETIAPSGKTRILFGCGLEDIKILQALVENAAFNVPRIKTEENSTIDLSRRLHSMAKTFSDFTLNKKPKLSKDKYKNTPCPYCEKTLRGKKGLENHILQVHSKQL